MNYCEISYEQIKKYGDQTLRYVIFAGPHKIKEHQCVIIGCNKGVRKICMHILVQCINCGGGHTTNSSQYILRHKAEIDTQKQKALRKTIKKGKARLEDIIEEKNDYQEEVTLSPNTGMDLEVED